MLAAENRFAAAGPERCPGSTPRVRTCGGRRLDIAEATPVYGSDVNIVGAKTYDILAGCDFVINTAGVPRDAPGRHLPRVKSCWPST
ncbi:MAG: hypothetical protein IPO18_08985 [bacterium]|nr:hypothetical protein [bacterium]